MSKRLFPPGSQCIPQALTRAWGLTGPLVVEELPHGRLKLICCHWNWREEVELTPEEWRTGEYAVRLDEAIDRLKIQATIQGAEPYLR